MFGVMVGRRAVQEAFRIAILGLAVGGVVECAKKYEYSSLNR